MFPYRYLLTPVLLSTAVVAAASDSTTQVDYRTEVLPILSDYCLECHGQDSATRAADLRLDQLEGIERVFRAPEPLQAEAWLRIESHDPDLRMPPVDSGHNLSASEIATLKRWIEQGAPWQTHWAFEPVSRPDVPQVANAEWVRNPIDAFVLERLNRQGLAPKPEADRAILARRVSLDLTGLAASMSEVASLLSDTSSDAYERFVLRMLNSPHYGEHMAVDWLDAARYADTNGYQNDFARTMWPWRDWVVNAFNSNMPFDQFTIEQLAGDLLPDASKSQLLATAFNRNNRTVTEAGSIEEEWLVENVADRVETVSTTWLGLTVSCARCHDHKFDPISQEEYYALFAYFHSMEEQGVYSEARGNVGPQLEYPTPHATHTRGQAGKRKPITVMITRELEVPRTTYVLQRGMYDAPDNSRPVEPATPEFLPQSTDSQKQDRLALAKWLVDRRNPLTARVQVNRLWRKFFGRGLVATPDDFGVRGEYPSHPELLDWLAVEFIESGWDLKHIQQLIVTSATYRQSSDATLEDRERDPDNRWLARGPRFRLPAEAIRDNALQASGLLTPTLGGPPIMPYQPEGLWGDTAGAQPEQYTQVQGEQLYRRSLYIYRKRTVPHPAVNTFDSPSWEYCQVVRNPTNTPLQALALLNDETYVEAARGVAVQMLARGGTDHTERLAYGFQLITGRPPTSREEESLGRMINSLEASLHGSPEEVDRLLTVGESPLPAGIDRSQLATYTLAASVLLNLDETITKR